MDYITQLCECVKQFTKAQLTCRLVPMSLYVTESKSRVQVPVSVTLKVPLRDFKKKYSKSETMGNTFNEACLCNAL